MMCGSCLTTKTNDHFFASEKQYKTCAECREYQKNRYYATTMTLEEKEKRVQASKKSRERKKCMIRQQRMNELIAGV